MTADTGLVRKPVTLCLVREPDRLLIGMKKRGFGEGRWNGFGGKLMPGETVEEAAARELKEEAGIEAQGLEKVGIMEFRYPQTPGEVLEVHLFRVDSYTGEPRETEEMRPEWHAIDALPFEQMWPDDRHWMPLFLAGKKFRGNFLFASYDEILEHSLEAVPAL